MSIIIDVITFLFLRIIAQFILENYFSTFIYVIIFAIYKSNSLDSTNCMSWISADQ